MLRYLLLLSAALFLTLTIAGHDRGQVRLGLTGAYAPPPPVPVTPVRAAQPAAGAAARAGEAPVVLAAFSPGPATSVPDPAPAAEPVAAEAEPPPAPAALPLMWVAASSVNLRAAPSTDAAVLDRLSRNEAVSVVGPGPEGWLRVRLEGDGGEGFVAARYLTDRDPAAN